MNRYVKAGGVAAVVAVAFTVLIALTRGGDGDTPGSGRPQAFFSTDDGMTWFTDNAMKVPPFSKDGKEAVRVHVFACPDGKAFAAWLERYTPQSRQKVEAMHAGGGNSEETIPLDAIEVEVKAPGQGKWVRTSDPQAANIMSPKCPSGIPKPVLPGGT